MVPATLNVLSPNIQPTLSLLAELDRCFLAGFANLERSHWQTLGSLQRVFSGTPLEKPLNHACAAIERNEFLEQHFMAVAAVRASLQGSLFDALQQQVREGLGRVKESQVAAESVLPDMPTHVQILLESVRHWLMEIAIIGYARLEASALAPFLSTLQNIQEEPLLIRQAALLTGFWNELMRYVPVTDSNAIPTYRWSDLWTRSLVGTLHSVPPETPKTISGTVELLGMDLRQHANLVSFTLYGVLTINQQPQLTRLTLSAYKVDAINNDELWLLFPNAVTLLEAFAQNKILHLKDVPLLPTGDLLLPPKCAVGSTYNLMQRAAECFAVNVAKVPIPCHIHPLDRHPIQLAEPIFLDGYSVKRRGNSLMLSWGEVGLPVALERINALSEVNQDAIANSTQLFGLLRFDAGRWAVQPLAVAVKGKLIFTGQKAAKILKSPPKNSTVSILQERASRLLRKR